MPYYPTIAAEMARQGITKKELANCIGISYRSLDNKLAGRVAFTWPEVEAIKNKFFPDMTPEVLFARAKTQDTE